MAAVAAEEAEEASGEGELVGENEGAILTALSSLKNEFSSRFDAVLKAIENMRKEISD